MSAYENVKEGDILYRYFGDEIPSTSSFKLTSKGLPAATPFKVVKVTPCTLRIVQHYEANDCFKPTTGVHKIHVIYKDAIKKFAYLTKEKAFKSYLIRKRRHLQHLTRQAEHIKDLLENATSIARVMEGEPKRLGPAKISRLRFLFND